MTRAEHIIVDKIKNAILSIDRNAELILFGSRARGDYKKDSDWDFLMLTEQPVTFSFKNEIIEHVVPIELDEDICIQILARNKEEWESKYAVTPLYLNIKDEGIVV